MATVRRAVLLSILAVALAALLLDVHGSVDRLIADLQDTWADLRGTRTDAG